MQKVLIVLTSDLVKQIDRQAKKEKLNRSQFIRTALGNYFIQLSVDETLAQENAARK